MIEVLSKVETNHIKFDFDLAFSIRKVREREVLKYQVILKNNKNGNELPIREVDIPAKFKKNTKHIISDYTAATLKRIIDEEQDRFDKMLEEFLSENKKNRTRRKKS